MLKYRLPDLRGIPPEVAAHYEPADDGGFVLRVEGVVAKARLDEFRIREAKIGQRGIEVDDYGVRPTKTRGSSTVPTTAAELRARDNPQVVRAKCLDCC